MEGTAAGPTGAGSVGDIRLPGQPIVQMHICPVDAVSEFECPVCFEYLCPPIHQCGAGHLLCSSCRPKMPCCPTCRGPLGENRCLALEKVASKLGFRCKFAGDGCGSVLLYTERTSHEDACNYRPYCCPYPWAGCKWQGPLDQVKPHLLITHKCEMTAETNEDFECWPVRLEFNIDVNMNMVRARITSWFGHDFLFVFEKRKIDGHEQYFTFVQLIGSRKDAEEFYYRLELGDPGNSQLTWTAKTRSIRDEGKSVILSADCLSFDKNTARFFYKDAEQGLEFWVQIWKVQE